VRLRPIDLNPDAFLRDIRCAAARRRARGSRSAGGMAPGRGRQYFLLLGLLTGKDAEAGTGRRAVERRRRSLSHGTVRPGHRQGHQRARRQDRRATTRPTCKRTHHVVILFFQGDTLQHMPETANASRIRRYPRPRKTTRAMATRWLSAYEHSGKEGDQTPEVELRHRHVVACSNSKGDNTTRNRPNGPFRISVRTGKWGGSRLIFVQAIPATLPATA
jgi:hypothetical protein